MRIITTALLMLVFAGSAAAQDSMSNKASPLMDSNRAAYDLVKRFVVAAAEQTSEEIYSFRPTPEVRSFGELVGHLADAQYLYCSAALGEQNPSSESVEKTQTSKAGLVEALRNSSRYCDRAFAEISDAQLAESANVFGQKATRLYALVVNISHDWEHYGNIVTYMRMNGLVPPSSQPRT